MSIEQALQQEIEESKKWLNIEKDESTYKRDLQKRIELINWVLENMNNPDIPICDNIESRMSDIILSINQTHSIFDADKRARSLQKDSRFADKLHSELRTLDWTFYQV